MNILKWLSDFFFNRAQQKLEGYASLVKNPKAIREERHAALEALVDLKEPNDALPLLLSRFDFSLEHGINDTREKELALSGVIKFKEKALPFVKEHLQQTSRIAWPIKALQELATEPELIDILMSCLRFGEVDVDQDIVDRNYDLLCYLLDFKLSKLQTESLVSFLNALDERVRFTVADVILNQNYRDLIVKHLECFLIDTSSENTRLRREVSEAYLKNGWIVESTQAQQGPFLNPIVLTPQNRLALNS